MAYLERAKSRVLLDYLSRSPTVLARDVETNRRVRELARVRDEHHWYFTQLHGQGLTPGVSEQQSKAVQVALRAELHARERRIAELLEELELNAPGHVPLGATISDWLSVFDDRIVLEYFVSASQSAAFARDGDRLTVMPLDVQPSQVQHLVVGLERNFQATSRMLTAGLPITAWAAHSRLILGQLFERLLAPLLACIDPARPLAIVPYGVLHHVPFHALFDGQRYLVERFEVATCPSSAVLATCRRRARAARRRALVLGHSHNGTLPFAVQEARAVAELFSGDCYTEDEATRARLVANAHRFDIVHIAAHGQARLDQPALSHLELADGPLQMTDIFSLDLDGALVTLSGCETGRPSVTRGDELLGLSRGFLYAGASTVVQSLWQVVDEPTGRQMEAFYRALRRGDPPARALRAAQCTSLGEAGRDGLHPYLWAPFQVVGDGGV